MVLISSSSKRPMGGQPKSEASSWSSPDVRALREEPTEAISQKPARGRRNPVPSGRGRCQHSLRSKTLYGKQAGDGDQPEPGQKMPMAMNRVRIPANNMPTANKAQRDRLQKSRYEDH